MQIHISKSNRVEDSWVRGHLADTVQCPSTLQRSNVQPIWLLVQLMKSVSYTICQCTSAVSTSSFDTEWQPNVLMNTKTKKKEKQYSITTKTTHVTHMFECSVVLLQLRLGMQRVYPNLPSHVPLRYINSVVRQRTLCVTEDDENEEEGEKINN